MNFGAGFFLPYEFSPTVLVLCVAAVVIYVRGLVRRRRAGITTGWPRALAFFVGVVLMYAVLQTHFDFMAQHMFFIQRLQHLALHHLGPFLIMLSAPGTVLAAGVPEPIRVRVLRPMARSPLLRWPYRVIQQPVIAGVLFVGLIYVCLLPSAQFYAMLSVPLYKAMDWAMAVDGLFFWYLMFCSPRPAVGGLRYGWRILILAATIPPQIVAGAYVALSGRDLYPIFASCGRLWPISATNDQVLGGLITWIPAAMMCVAGGLVLLHHWTQEEAEEEPRPRTMPASVPQPVSVPEAVPEVNAHVEPI
ncbi:MAG: cytochrome c oxidase assembly protein [Gammaproteobacteria bacterium]